MTVRIYQPAKSTTQSGRGKNIVWRLEFEADSSKNADLLMGWLSSTDTRQQVKLKFPTQESAIAYAKSNNLNYTIVPVSVRALKLQSYADNFK
jgi:ETC complex I subunit conserved region